MTDLAMIYSRKSDPNAKANDPSFEQQESECRKYCEDQGYIVVGAQREAYTGTDLANQQMLWECIDAVKTGRANVVVAYSYDRLSRDLTMQTVALYDIENKYGGRFEAATEQVDRDDPIREGYRVMLGLSSQMERRRSVGRMQRGKKDRSNAGALYGCPNAKFGYRWADDFKSSKGAPGHTRYEIDNEAAEVVQRIFELAASGKGIRWIARLLNAERVPTPSQTAAAQGHIGGRHVGDMWRHVGLMKMLQDPAYCGQMQAYKRQSSHSFVKNPTTGIMEKKLVVTERDVSERIPLSEDTCPALVPVDQWEKVQAILAGNKQKEGRPPRDPEMAMMRGYVYCKCGRRMGLTLQRTGVYNYRCPNRPSMAPDPERACPHGDQAIRASVINRFVLVDVSKEIAKRGLLRKLLEQKFADDKPLRQITENLQALIDRKTTEREKYVVAIGTAQDATVVKALVEKAEACAKEISEATAYMTEAKLELLSIDRHNTAVERAITLFEQWPSNGLYAVTPAERRRLFSQIGLKVTVAPAGQAAAHKGAERLSATFEIQEDLTGSDTIFSMMASATWEVPTAVGSSGRGLRS
jgi:site-specific DNA recombinase